VTQALFYASGIGIDKPVAEPATAIGIEELLAASPHKPLT
jgi:hypothetical protein